MRRETVRLAESDRALAGSSVDNEAAGALWEHSGATRESDRSVEFTYHLS